MTWLAVLLPLFLVPLAFWWCCCSEGGGDCECCQDTLPDQMQIEITGLADSSCTDCNELNGIYVLDKYSPCRASYTPDGEEQFCGDDVRMFLEVLHTPVLGEEGLCNIEVHVLNFLTPINHLYFNTVAETFSAKVDCQNLVNELMIASMDGTPCDITSASALLTSL